MRHRSAAGILPLVAALSFVASAAASEIEIRSGTTTSGEATPLWRAAVARLKGEAAAAALDGERRVRTSEETAWAELIHSRVAAWRTSIAPVVELYAPAVPPARVTVVLGNRGATDGFTHDAATIGFDLSELEKAYGAAHLPGNRERIDRLFTHEYAHLMQKSWQREHPWEADTPFRAAVLGIWLEGAGNYFSMSDTWRSPDGVPSPRAASTLAVLEPRFVARMASLACADRSAAALLTADLSQGRFDRKWGGLTMALWLEAETGLDPAALRTFVARGPDAVLEVAGRRLPPPLAAVLAEARAAADLCTR